MGADGVYYVGDHLGSSTLLTDAEGRVVSEAAYDAWGTQIVATTEPYTFTGQEWDDEAGVYYAGARYYDPELGRFLSVDPATLENPGLGASDPQVLNPYAYARNTPTSLIDRDGRFAHIVGGALAGALINTGIYVAKQLITGQEVTGRGALAAAASGAVTGAIGAATAGLGLAARVGSAVVENVAGGVVERGVETGSVSEAFDLKKMAEDATSTASPLAVVSGGAKGSKSLGGGSGRAGNASSKHVDRGGGCSGSCGIEGRGCFVAGTRVRLADGTEHPIEALVVGDEVLAPSDHSTPEALSAFRVVDTSARRVQAVLDLTFEGASGERQVLTSTLDHPYLRVHALEPEWVEAQALQLGDRVASPGGALALVAMQARFGDFEVFNLEVEGAHAYLVGDAGLVVHNGLCSTGDGKAAKETTKYVRPSGATTPAQRASVQGKPCVDCGVTAPKMNADHKSPLVKQHYEGGGIDKAQMRSPDAVQPQCPTCSNRQGADLSRYSRQKAKELGHD